jgi:hypothetical protein
MNPEDRGARGSQGNGNPRNGGSQAEITLKIGGQNRGADPDPGTHPQGPDLGWKPINLLKFTELPTFIGLFGPLEYQRGPNTMKLRTCYLQFD